MKFRLIVFISTIFLFLFSYPQNAFTACDYYCTPSFTPCVGIFPNLTYCTNPSNVCSNPLLSRACQHCTTAAECPSGVAGTPTPAPVVPQGSKIGLSGPADCDDDRGIPTALGCIPTEQRGLISVLIKWSVGLAGLAVLGVFAYSGILIISSSGDPKRIKAAQEMFIAAISGAILIVLSIVILNFIGIKILNLGSLGFNV